MSASRIETARRHDEVVARVLFYIDDRLQEPLTLEKLAEVAGFSPHHFHRVFRHATGESPKQYVRRLRLERAVYRMKVSPDNVLQIAVDSGFASHETFTRAFIRQFDISPSEFRAVLMGYRAAIEETFARATFDGLTDDTPLTLRFDMDKTPLTVELTPGRHLLFVRHFGYEQLLAQDEPLLGLWDEVFGYAARRGIHYDPTALVAIMHDDPYVTDERRIRFDTCIQIQSPIPATYPVGYRYLPPRLCVARRHGGGLEEFAKTFALVGVDWLLAGDYGLATAPPFEVYSCSRASDDRLDILRADAYVPLDTTTQGAA